MSSCNCAPAPGHPHMEYCPFYKEPPRMVEVRADFEVGPFTQPATRAEALILGQAWGRELSHLNNLIMLERHDDNGPRREETLAWVAQADAAEVERLVALWRMLPERVKEGD